MKKSELRSLIREEIKKSIAQMYGSDEEIQKSVNKIFKTGNSSKSNTLGLPLEKLSGYDKLPNTRAEADLSSRNYILLPSLRNTGAKTYIYSKEEAQEWSNNFIDQYGIDGDKILFINTNTGADVINSPGYKGDKESTSKSISSFYDRLNYKGD